MAPKQDDGGNMGKSFDAAAGGKPDPEMVKRAEQFVADALRQAEAMAPYLKNVPPALESLCATKKKLGL
ncbi:hypothetical protein [Arvimicrobium flavum]|uniref:hypothetical protein n=1 Tax=Arvimicrobium flavum TaxID=3393320 RepID=UPI00237B8DDA|nr:hypothetical protein [Mesorhizobium shangrilense]